MIYLLGHFKHSWLLVAILLAGCVNSPELPATDTIVSVQFIENGFIANSVKYSYKFDRIPEENKKYREFYTRFHQVAYGMKANFNVNGDIVEATYLVVFEKNKINSQQYAELVNEYRAYETDNNYISVGFYAKGNWYLSQSQNDNLGKNEELERPVPVSINEKINISTAGQIALIPLLPVLIFGLKP